MSSQNTKNGPANIGRTTDWYYGKTGGMPAYFESIMDMQLAKAFSHVNYGGAESGEIFSTIKKIKDGDFESWTQAWSATAARVENVARDCLAKGHTVSARDAFKRASSYWQSASFFCNYKDPRQRQYGMQNRICFKEACKLMDPQIEYLEIGIDNGKSLPGYFIRADKTGEPKPTLLVMGGGDTFSEEIYYWGDAAHAADRGWNALMFDVSGEAGALVHDPELKFRPDVEVPISRFVDYALSRPDVDPDKIAINGHSFGGYMVPRAVAYDHRIKAAIAYPTMSTCRIGWMGALGLNPFEPYPRDLESVVDLSNSVVRWLLDEVRWTHGMQDKTLAEFLDFASQFTVEGLEDKITCHYLNMSSEGEGGAIGLAREYISKMTNCASLTDRLITAEEGGDAHCGLNNPSLKAQIEFDWLDDVFGLTRHG
ncbi:MAG: alpha/beta hydrolase [Lacrimispora sp.]